MSSKTISWWYLPILPWQLNPPATPAPWLPTCPCSWHDPLAWHSPGWSPCSSMSVSHHRPTRRKVSLFQQRGAPAFSSAIALRDFWLLPKTPLCQGCCCHPCLRSGRFLWCCPILHVGLSLHGPSAFACSGGRLPGSALQSRSPKYSWFRTLWPAGKHKRKQSCTTGSPQRVALPAAGDH